MANKAQFIGKVTNGHLTCGKDIMACVRILEGKTAKITIEELKRKRSLNQNAFYWGAVIPAVVGLFREHGQEISSDDAHDYLRCEVGGLWREIVSPDNKVCKVVKPSAGLTTTEWEDYIEKIRAWAAEYHVEIPFPNEEIMK